MFKFGQKNKDSLAVESDKTIKSVNNLSDLIHVMPDRFYVKPKQRNVGLILVLLAGVLLLAGVSAAAYFLVVVPMMQPKTADIVEEKVTDVVDQPDVTSVQDVPVESATSTTATSTDITATDNTTGQATGSTDTDGDKLTDNEELLHGTNVNLADTDGDSYQDGAELISGFDPNKAGLSLGASGLFKSYNSVNYTISFPTKWQLREDDDAAGGVLFISEISEFVEIVEITNNVPGTIEDWFKAFLPEVNLDPQTYINVSGAVGVRINNGRTYYLYDPSDDSKIYMITYNPGKSSVASFDLTFGVMITSFKILP